MTLGPREQPPPFSESPARSRADGRPRRGSGVEAVAARVREQLVRGVEGLRQDLDRDEDGDEQDEGDEQDQDEQDEQDDGEEEKDDGDEQDDQDDDGEPGRRDAGADSTPTAPPQASV